MKNSCLIILFFCFMLMEAGYSQVSISTDNSSADPSAMLDVKSNSRGFLPPRLTRAEIDALNSPAEGLVIFCTNCNITGGGSLILRVDSNWFTLTMNCLLPMAPPAATQVAQQNQITWNWAPVSDALGYKWGTTNNFNSATDMGLAVTKTETDLPCNTPFTRYVWSYNNCGYSGVTSLQQSTATCPPDCGGPFTDPRDGKVYGTTWIGTQCWFTRNLNIGTRIGNAVNAANNGVIEKYCYVDMDSYCDIYGGLYSWDELMDYTTSSSTVPSGRQGICPVGWHIPSDAEFCQMEVYLDPTISCTATGWRGTNAGGKLKETGYAHWQYPNTGATNASGFTALPGGHRNFGSGFNNVTSHSFFYTATEQTSILAYYRSIYCESALINRNHTGNYFQKGYGFSVRCVKDY